MADLEAYPEIAAELRRFDGLQRLGEAAFGLLEQATQIGRAIGETGVKGLWCSELTLAGTGLMVSRQTIAAYLAQLEAQKWEVPLGLHLVLVGDTVTDLGVEEWRMTGPGSENDDSSWVPVDSVQESRGMSALDEDGRPVFIAHALEHDPVTRTVRAHRRSLGTRASYGLNLERQLMTTSEVRAHCHRGVLTIT